jgi:hypothetical protein
MSHHSGFHSRYPHQNSPFLFFHLWGIMQLGNLNRQQIIVNNKMMIINHAIKNITKYKIPQIIGDWGIWG